MIFNARRYDFFTMIWNFGGTFNGQKTYCHEWLPYWYKSRYIDILKFRKWLIIDLLKVGETCETFSHRTFYVYVTIPLNPLSRHFVLLAAKVHWTFDLSLATYYRPKGLKNKVLLHLRKLSRYIKFWIYQIYIYLCRPKTRGCLSGKRYVEKFGCLQPR